MSNDKDEIILISISGHDKPGVTSALTGILGKFGSTILDIGQSDIHHRLSLGILFKTTSNLSGEIMKELFFKATEMGVSINYTPIAIDDYQEWVGLQGKNRYIITILGREITAEQISAISGIVAQQGLNIDDIKRLTGRIPITNDGKTPQRSCIEFSVRGNPIDKEAMQTEFMRISNELGFDVSLQEDNMYRRCRRLICFDMDSTLIQTECIDELAIRAGVGDKVKAITASAMRGEIDFKESFTQRVALLKGLDVSVMKEIADHLPITEGVDRLMRVLKRTGYKIAILSGGFTYFGNVLKNKYGIDYVLANAIQITENGNNPCRNLEEICTGRRKAELLSLLAQVENVNIAQTIAVGDGANDLPMLKTAGLGIAFRAKPKVKETAQQSISTIGIDGVLYFLGFKDSFMSE